MKKYIRIFSFLFILILVLGFCNSIFKMKFFDGIFGLTKFYELQNNTVDVLFLGSSHSFANINTGTLWDDYGISSFDLGGSVQPMWNTYYYLKEALKTQSPKVIVLEGYGTSFSFEFSDDSRIIKNNFGLHWSMDKIESLKASAPKERFFEFFLEYTQYHTRYKELKSEDFLEDLGNPMYKDWKGFTCLMNTKPFTARNVSKIKERIELVPKTEKYYRAILELAQEKDIPIIVIISPYPGISKNQQRRYNKASDIAAEYGIPFINYNLMVKDIGIDYSVDAADKSHLNFRGNQKYANYIGEYLVSNYVIPDHRGDEHYSSWQDMADYLRQMIYDQELKETKDFPSFAEKIQNENYWIFLSVDGKADPSDEGIKDHLKYFGIIDYDENGIWYFRNNILTWKSTEEDNEYFKRTKLNDINLKRTDMGENIYKNEIIVDRKTYKKAENGINIVIFNTMTSSVADVIGIDMDKDYKIVR